jgi:general secretion pathway protein K
MSARKGERGMALLLVLMVVALLTTLLVEFAFSTLVDLRLTETFRDSTQAYYLAKGGINAGTMLLREDHNRYDSLDEAWHQGISNYPVGHGSVSIQISDLGGKLAVNRLVEGNNPQTVMVDRFYRFFSTVGLDRQADPAELTAALIDWLDSGDETYRELRVDGRVIPVAGAEAAYYRGLPRPYACKNGKLHTLDELALVKGFTPEVLRLVTPHLAVNGEEAININTASVAVLMTLDPLIDRPLAEKVVAYRANTPITGINNLESILPANVYSALRTLEGLGQLGVTSQLYRIEADALVNDGHRRMVAEVEKKSSRLLYLKVD